MNDDPQHPGNRPGPTAKAWNAPNRQAAHLSLTVPEPEGRPGDRPCFGAVDVGIPGAVVRPDIDCAAAAMREHAFSLIRVLDDEGFALGPWNPRLDAATLRAALRKMMLTRAFDDRMYAVQRQGKTSFFMKSTGEEAVGTAHAMALEPGDMCFATYRLQSFLIARGYPILDMMNQIFSNPRDPLKGLQLPVLYSARDHGFFSLSGNVATQYCQAVGWAMASAYKHDTRIASAYIGEGATAEGDFHHALTFAAVYRAPVILNIVNNQWAISSFHGIAGGLEVSFAAKALGYGLAALRVDGNDVLAVYATARWAAARARANLGATVIELYTYRAGPHSTSDDPNKYRPADEAKHWPLGDPIARLKQHLVAIGAWSQEQHEALQSEVTAEVRAALGAAEAAGTLRQAKPDPGAMFDHVFKEPDWRLRSQRSEAGF